MLNPAAFGSNLFFDRRTCCVLPEKSNTSDLFDECSSKRLVPILFGPEIALEITW